MIAAFRRFFRRFSPRVVEISVIEERTGSSLLRVDEKTIATLAALQGHPGVFEQKFLSTAPLRLCVRVIP